MSAVSAEGQGDENLRPGDRLFIIDGDLVLKFSTATRCAGGKSGQTLWGRPEAE